MKKYILLIMIAMVLSLSACTQPTEVVCGEGTVKIDGKCELDTLKCDYGYHNEEGVCVLDEEEVTCNDGYHEENGTCVVDVPTCNYGYHLEDNVCVIDPPLELPDWFEGWDLLTEPIGNKDLRDLEFSDTGFSIYLNGNSRVGITLDKVTLTPGYYYEVRFDYSADVAGKGLFVQLQGHGGNVFTSPNVMTTTSVETFSQILPFPPTANGTNDGWLTIELLPSIAGEVTINNIQIIETALPTCGVNEVIKGIECVAANNGFLPNGTPTAWFTGWEILTNPGGNKDISDYEFSDTGFTAYLDAGERTGIQMMDYVFESGYTYELSFDYTASEAGRMIWVQMVALGGYEFTNTETWSVNGTETFTQSLTIPSSYVPVEPGWIKLELTPGALDNVTIENIVITKTAN